MRQNTFTSIALANAWHNITYTGTKSFDLIHKMSQRSVAGELDRHLIIMYEYGHSLSLEVLVKGERVRPFAF